MHWYLNVAHQSNQVFDEPVKSIVIFTTWFDWSLWKGSVSVNLCDDHIYIKQSTVSLPMYHYFMPGITTVHK